MAMIDSHRRNVERKRYEIARLIDQKAKEYAKITSLNNKVQSATKRMNSSKSLATISSRQKEIYKYQAEISKVEKKISELEIKISRKNKELQPVQRKIDNVEVNEYKKRQKQQDKFQREQTSAFSTVNKILSEHSNMIKNLSELPKEITVLFLASNPQDQGQLRLDEEVRSIKEMITKSRHRDAVKLESCWAIRPGDILQYMNEYMPTIVHFSGHGSSNDELVLMDNNFNTKLVSQMTT